jgi:hypothetical protein
LILIFRAPASITTIALQRNHHTFVPPFLRADKAININLLAIQNQPLHILFATSPEVFARLGSFAKLLMATTARP